METKMGIDLENFPTRETAKDMLGMVSPVYDQSYVGKWIYQIMALYLSRAQEAVMDLRSQEFPETATWSIPFWEQSYRIEENTALSMEERRLELLLKKYSRKPMNPARIEALLKEMCGRTCHLIENVAPHTFQIEIDEGLDEVDLPKIRAFLDKYKQSQKVYWIHYLQAIQYFVEILCEAVSLILTFGVDAQSAKNFRPGGEEARMYGMDMFFLLSLFAAPEEHVLIEFPARILQEVDADAGSIAAGFSVAEETDIHVQAAAGMAVSVPVEYDADVYVENDLWYLDGTYLLDGTKKIDAGTYTLDL